MDRTSKTMNQNKSILLWGVWRFFAQVLLCWLSIPLLSCILRSLVVLINSLRYLLKQTIQLTCIFTMFVGHESWLLAGFEEMCVSCRSWWMHCSWDSFPSLMINPNSSHDPILCQLLLILSLLVTSHRSCWSTPSCSLVQKIMCILSSLPETCLPFW